LKKLKAESCQSLNISQKTRDGFL